ncbi:hypothetical protein J6590_077452 [Homalodisca vitripennis]|nr:hypothetical protein J6590_077452 [Homalodisca vitripennis]
MHQLPDKHTTLKRQLRLDNETSQYTHGRSALSPRPRSGRRSAIAILGRYRRMMYGGLKQMFDCRQRGDHQSGPHVINHASAAGVPQGSSLRPPPLRPSLVTITTPVAPTIAGNDSRGGAAIAAMQQTLVPGNKYFLRLNENHLIASRTDISHTSSRRYVAPYSSI